MSIDLFYKKSSFFLSFAKFAGKHCWNLFCNEVAGLRPATLLKRRLQHRYFPVNIAKLLRTPILKNICERLFLYFRIVKKKIYFEKWKNGKSKTRKSRKSRRNYSEYSIFSYSENRKPGFKNLGKKFQKFSRFLNFRPGLFSSYDLVQQCRKDYFKLTMSQSYSSYYRKEILLLTMSDKRNKWKRLLSEFFLFCKPAITYERVLFYLHFFSRFN